MANTKPRRIIAQPYDFSVQDLVDKIKNKDIDLVKIIKSCKRTNIKDQNIFQIPQNILFTNEQ